MVYFIKNNNSVKSLNYFEPNTGHSMSISCVFNFKVTSTKKN